MRVGFGYDVHRLVEGRPLILGGVTIPHDRGLEGHSDADALLHAITDAILGAAGLGDIGSHFPDTDAEWKDADSTKLLAMAMDAVRQAGFRIGNIDATVVLERPKLRPHIDDMREAIADAVGCGIDVVSVKATTNEGMGFVGVEEGAAAYAVALLVPSE
ncbi:2-C-methyl-D-erythritol 2,4-cyclodiphosphate synthase [Longibacter salinarum]|uniref:2-C-methyl-D-erythritol 2,4-cyclodiphosphate synthase n=1 Tax=Longibacter salinarum TaxID=1850348 RepID=A0A2A8CW32_9BACT|nr:2-C-methyl-D-erythritol 2,4-cyclodiphosphate synthase [Longibacter salinarum]PEN12959.1 2-C-methyl-D-erythritol 2,4-cyclodiphosphate synthase [Longibacter salinarum]